ncbi:MAG: hypothetical protein M5F18_09525 [Asgard group archaeon]|nr:hypothetical protein [Asgard group archaeon]
MINNGSKLPCSINLKNVYEKNMLKEWKLELLKKQRQSSQGTKINVVSPTKALGNVFTILIHKVFVI